MFKKEKPSVPTVAEVSLPGFARGQQLRADIEAAFDTPVTENLLKSGAPVHELIGGLLESVGTEETTLAATKTEANGPIANLVVMGLTKATTSKERTLEAVVEESKTARAYELNHETTAEDVLKNVAINQEAAVMKHEDGTTEFVLPTTVGGVVLRFAKPEMSTELHYAFEAAA